MTPTIIQVPVDLIDPHPSNPRRDLGDLTELADSIRAHGVRQNLILVPHCSGCPDVASGLRVKDDGASWCTIHKREGRLRALIGHRRLAAARMAGLTEVPAVIDPTLSDADQVELMLLENVQRSDLSPVEEAEGYQQLLDLGVAVTMIAKRTGRARKTIDGRLKLLSLPEEAREKVHVGEVTLEDAAALAEFEDDPEEHRQLLEALGTSNWDWKLRNAKNDRANKVKKRKLVDKLIKMGAVEVHEAPGNGFVLVDRLYSDDPAPKSVEPGSVVVLDYSVNVYRPATDEELAKADKSAAAKERREEKQRAEDDARALAEAERVTAYERRDEFVRSLVARKALKANEVAAIVETMARGFVLRSGVSGMYQLASWLGHDADTAATRDEWYDTQAFPAGAVLLAALHVDIGGLRYGGWERAKTNPKVHDLYRLLESLGMVLSDVERARCLPDAAEAS